MIHLHTPFANLPFTVKYTEEMNFDLLSQAINHVIRCNDGLRIRLREVEQDGLIEIRQYISGYAPSVFDRFDFAGPGGSTRLTEWLDVQRREPFELIDSDLFYFALLRYSDTEWGYYFKTHHIISDGWTVNLLVQQIAESYAVLVGGGTLSDETNPSYIQYLDDEREYLASAACESDRSFWHDRFLPLPEEIVLPFLKNKSDRIIADSKVLSFSPELRAKMHEFSKLNHSSIFKLVLSALSVYLNRITGLEDVVFTTVSHGRETDAQKRMTGMFVSTFPVRIKVDKDMPFTSFAESAGRELNEVIRNHSRYPLDQLIMDLREKSGNDPSWFLNIMLVGHPNLTEDAVRLEYIFSGCEPSPLTIHINASGKDVHGLLELQFDYNVDLFEEDNIVQIFEAVCTILDSAISNPTQMVREIELVSAAEREQLLVEFNNTHVDFPAPLFIKDLFEEQVKRTPDKTAVVYKGESISYDALNRKANQLADKLISTGAGPGMIIGILPERSLEMVISVMAVIKSGCAYVPIDPAYPPDRIQYMLEDSHSFALISHRHLKDSIGFTGPFFDLDDAASYSGDGSNPDSISKPGDLVYVIYTSGSTGKPKGVMVSHWALAHFVLWYKSVHNLSDSDNTTKFASFGFDVTVWEIFPALVSGATLHVIADDIRLSPIQLNEYFEANKITVAFLPTQFGEQFIENITNNSLRWLDVAGEKLRSYKKHKYTLMNGYGPTEYADCTTWFIVDKYRDNIPIGKPIWNTRIYILDKFDKLRPIGIPGELCVAGIGIADGYLGKPELTAEKFVDDPFRAGEKMYRTGDLCRRLPDGNIEYLGRIDFQVKIRGFRVELGEIEQAMKDQDHVTDAVVVNRADPSGRNYLAGYYVADRQLDAAQISEQMAIDLPEYMIPRFLMQIESMPLTPNGKIDRKALPEHELTTDHTLEYAAPSTQTEKAVAAMWEQILGVDAVGANDDFFLLGGHSLKAALLQARIQKDFCIQLSLQNIFHNSVLHDLASLIDSSTRQEYAKITHVADRQHYPPASAQKRLFIVNQMENIGITYNIPIVTMLEGELDTNMLSEAIEEIAERHEVFRTSFDIVDGEPVQTVHPKVHIKRFYMEADEKDIPRVIDEFIKPFDLRVAPLFRAGLVKLDDNKHLFMFDVHHIIFDGWSMQVFFDELWELYRGRKLPARKLQYRDYAIWQQQIASGSRLKAQEEYWMRLFSGDVPTLNIETDFARGSSLSFAGARMRSDIDHELTTGLRELARNEGVTLFMVLFSAWSVLLSKYSNQEDIVVGIPSSGRTIPELEHMIGMFVNSLPLRSHPSGSTAFNDYLSEIKALVLDAYDNQDYQLDSLVEKLGIARNSGRNPLFDVMFAFRQQPDDIDLGNIKAKFIDFTFSITKFDLTLEVIEHADTLQLEIEYRTALYSDESMHRMSNHYINLLRGIVADAKAAIRDYDVLMEQERRFVLNEYNNTRSDYPKDRTIAELFEEQVRTMPDRVAVEHDNRTMTYMELNDNANRFARVLRSKGIKPDDVIGVMMEQGIEFIVAILGIMKSGGAYLPIDPEYPEERIQYILENSGSPVLITTSAAKQKAADFKGEIMTLETGCVFEGDSTNLNKVSKQSDLVYIIYTSGSTGKPKGVMITHQGLVNYITWAVKVYLEGESIDFPLYSSISFDLTVTSIFTPLVSGSRIVVYAGGDKSTLIERLIKEDKVGIVKLTPTHLSMIENLDCSRSRINRFIVGGEELRTVTAVKILAKFNHGVKIFNEYGPTETVVGCMIHLFDPNRDTRPAVPIGVPADNARIYLLDRYLNPVPMGVTGEMYIAGDGVARGYMNRPDITAERFLVDPFHPDDRMYKTGDLAKFLPDGTIEFLGRIDFQVKIRGFRIELGEIESKLSKLPDVKDAVVLPQQDESGITYLCAYYVADRKIPVNEIKTHLAEYLPDYMIPSYFIPLDVIPLTPNGKVDRNKLPKSGETVYTGVEFVDPRNETETYIRDAFVRVLHVNRVGVNDNFFDLGGNSLRAVALVAELQKQFDVTMNDVFQYQTTARLGSNIRKAKDDVLTRLKEIRDSAPSMISAMKTMMETPEASSTLSAYKARYMQLQKEDLGQKRKYENIMLTGATGFLGVYLLRDLLEKTDSRITTIVRAETGQAAVERLRSKADYYFGEGFFDRHSERITVLSGDLSAYCLGQSQSDYDALAAGIDCIIHSAALVKHYGHYEEFHHSNVKSVENLITFAGCGRIKDIHHISTISVGMGNVQGKETNIFTEYDLDSGQQCDLHYLVTKLEAEKMLHDARDNGLMANIYRIGNITFDSSTGRSQENIADNAFFQVVRSFVTLGAVPDGMDETEFSFVDQVSRAILHLFDREALRNETFHIRNSQLVKQSKILTNPALGLRINKVGFEAFVDRLIENYQVTEFRPHVQAVLLHFGWLDNRPAGHDSTVFVPVSGRTDHILNLTGFKWPQLDVPLMKLLILESLRERIKFLKELPLFSSLDEKDIASLAGQAVQRNFEENSDILWEGEPNDYLYIVGRGNVEVSRHSSSGWLGTVMIAGKGELLGADQLYADSNSSITAEALLDDVHVYAFRSDDMRRMIGQSPELGSAFIRMLAEKVNRLSSLFVNME